MVIWSELYHLIFGRYEHQLKVLTIPLKDRLGVTFFGHHAISDRGDYSVFGNRPDWAELYISEKMHENDPFLCAPSSYHSGMCPLEQKETLDLPWSKMMVCEGLILIERKPSKVEFSFFGGPSRQGNFTKFLLNHTALLKSYISHFKSETKNLLRIQQERGFCLPIRQRIKPLIPQMDLEQRWSFLNAIGHKKMVKQFLSLSPQELNCFKGIHQGKTAKEIASELALSQRTVEFYIDNVRNKMNCSTKQELIAQADILLLNTVSHTV